mgnify:CR=1 FL=1
MVRPGQVTVVRDPRATKDPSRLIVVNKDVGVGKRRIQKESLRAALASVPLKVARYVERQLMECMDLEVRFILS